MWTIIHQIQEYRELIESMISFSLSKYQEVRLLVKIVILVSIFWGISQLQIFWVYIWVVMVHTFNPRTQETKASVSLWVQRQAGIYSEFQDSQRYNVRPCLKNRFVYNSDTERLWWLQIIHLNTYANTCELWIW